MDQLQQCLLERNERCCDGPAKTYIMCFIRVLFVLSFVSLWFVAFLLLWHLRRVSDSRNSVDGFPFSNTHMESSALV